MQALDLVQYSLLTLGLFLFVPSLAHGVFRPMAPWYLVPSCTLAGAAFLLPGRSRTPAIALTIWKLRLSAVLAIGFAPFVFWYRNGGENTYLWSGAFLAVLCFFWHLGEYAGLFRAAASQAGAATLCRRTTLLRQWILYVAVVPLISLHVSFAAWPLVKSQYAFREVFSLWLRTPLLFAVVLSAPVLLFFVFAGSFRHAAVGWPNEIWQEIAPQESDRTPVSTVSQAS